ncbi:hypothetical protein ACEPAG_4745 [Sanghuangporus baumii]
MSSKKADNSEDLFDVPAEAPPAYDDVNPNSPGSSRAAISIVEKPLASLSSTAHASRSSSGGGSQFLPSPGPNEGRPRSGGGTDTKEQPEGSRAIEPGGLPSLDSAANGVPEAAFEAARGRKLTPGSWAVALAILDASMQCYARTRLIIAAQSSPPDLLSSNTQNDSSTKPPIIFNLASSGSRPLTAIHSLGDSASMSSSTERIRREHARSRSRRMAQGTWEDQQESARLAEKVLFSGIENTASPEVKGRELMYDGSPYIMSDGSLHAILDVQLTTSPPGNASSVDCVIC